MIWWSLWLFGLAARRGLGDLRGVAAPDRR